MSSLQQRSRVNGCHGRKKAEVLIGTMKHAEAVVLRLIHIAGKVASVHPQSRTLHLWELRPTVGASPRNQLSSSAAEIAAQAVGSDKRLFVFAV